jgi:hypothetical protein
MKTAMPISASVDRNRRLICITVQGPLRDEDLRQLSKQVRAEPAFGDGLPVLYDCTGATEILVTGDMIFNLGTAARGDHNLVAFVASTPAAFGLARMYQIVADENGSRVRVFATAHEALAWLAERQST